MLVLPLCLTSCEGTLDDIFGEWDKPSPEVPASAVEEAKVLGAALEKGAIVTVTYTVGSTTYTAKFEKGDGDNYTLISNTSGAGARAMTRAATPGTVPEGAGSVVGNKIRLLLGGDKLKLVVKDTNDAPLFEAHMNVEGGETAVFNTNALGLNCGISTFAVNEVKKDIKINVMKGANVSYDYEFTIESSVYYAKFESVVLYDEDKRETWADVIARYKDINLIGTTDDGIVTISFNKEVAIDVIKGVSGLSASDDIIGELANTVSQIKFYLYTKEEVNWSARAMTRVRSTYKYTPVKSTDVVDCTKTYILSPAMGHALTSAAVGELIGSDGKAYDVDYKNDLSSIGVTAVAKVIYVGSETGDATYNHGLALALKDESSDRINFSSAKTACESKTAVTDASWILASESQWNTMISAAGTYTDLRDGFESVGGTNMQSDFYWSSTEVDVNDDAGAKNYNFGSGGWQNSYQSNTKRARACLVF